jgi:uncharacterized protein YdeI (YjbR/CyaY-like superfamily)
VAPRTVRRSGGSRGRGSQRRSGKTATSKKAAAAGLRKARPGAGRTSGTAETSGESRRFAADALERLSLSDRASWRAWLEGNHGRVAGVWLVSFKKATGKPRLEYEHAVEEALCFGWIDSLVRTLDEERAMQLFTPRKPRSQWSKPNKIRVERLVAAGLMHPAGLAKIEQARRDGSWDAYAVAESLELPPDLCRAFESGPPGSRSSWDAFSPSSRRAILWWVHSAKRPETRARRVAQVVSEAARGRRANFPEDRR